MNQTTFRPQHVALLAGLLWAMTFAPSVTAAVYAANPYIDGDTRYEAGETGLARRDAAQPAPTWQALDSVALFEPVPAGERVLVGSRQGLFAVSAATGELLWRHAAGVHLYSPTIEDGIAYVGGADGSLRALDVRDGRMIWQIRMPGWLYPPVVRDGLVVTGGQAGVVWAVSARTGSRVWQRDLGQELVYRVVELDAGRVLVTTFDARATALDLRDGTIAWRRDTGSAMVSARVSGEVIELEGFDHRPLHLRVFDGARM